MRRVFSYDVVLGVFDEDGDLVAERTLLIGITPRRLESIVVHMPPMLRQDLIFYYTGTDTKSPFTFNTRSLNVS